MKEITNTLACSETHESLSNEPNSTSDSLDLSKSNDDDENNRESIKNKEKNGLIKRVLSFFKDREWQPVLSYFPLDEKNRKFLTLWYSLFEWLEYNVGLDRAFCIMCKKYSANKVNLAFTEIGYKSWSNAMAQFREHANSRAHGLAKEKWITRNKDQRSVAVAIQSQHSVEVENRRNNFKVTLKILLYFGTQGIALRDHDESVQSKNKGNFLELIDLVALHQSPYAEFIKTKAKNTNYLSPEIQNEVFSLFSGRRNCFNR